MKQSNTSSLSHQEKPDGAHKFRAMLVDINSGEKTVITSNDFAIGRSRHQADLRITHPCVSCVHCRFSFRVGGLHIEDCSRHGILLNGRRIDGGILQDGDLLQIINTRFRLVIKSTKRRKKVRRTHARRPVPAANVTAENEPSYSSNLTDDDNSDWHIESTGTAPMRWLLRDNTQESGPFSYSTLHQMRKVGAIIPNTMVRRVTGDRWHRADEIVGLFRCPSRTPADQHRRLKQPGCQSPRSVSMGDTDNLGQIGDATVDGLSPSPIAGSGISVLLGSEYNSATIPVINSANSAPRVRDTSRDDFDLELTDKELYALQALIL